MIPNQASHLRTTCSRHCDSSRHTLSDKCARALRSTLKRWDNILGVLRWAHLALLLTAYLSCRQAPFLSKQRSVSCPLDVRACKHGSRPGQDLRGEPHVFKLNR